MSSIMEVMNSQNLAVIGASRNPVKPGALLIKVLQDTGFKGKVAGVNTGGGDVYGTTLYPDLESIPFAVDLAIFYIPPGLVPEMLEQCALKGVKGVVISAEGFAESGEDGREVQERVQEILKKTGIRAFGPNTLGVVNTETGLTTSYFSNQEMLQPGSIGFAAQSGVFVGALLRYFTSLGKLGISKGMGLGNKVDVDECDALNYFHADPQTRFIGLYLEDVRDGRRFLETARLVARDKPLLVLKGGRTARGAQATASHTASLAVDDSVFAGALRQAGAIRMESIEEMMQTMMGFAWMPLPAGNKIALVTYSGAQAIMSIDAAMQAGLELAEFAPQTRDKISEVIATDAKSKNPIDIFPDMMAHGFEKTITRILSALFEDAGVHGIILINFAQSGAQMYQPVIDVWRQYRSKPLFVSLMGVRKDNREGGDFFLENEVPFYPYPEAGVRVFSKMWQYAKQKNKTTAMMLPAIETKKSE
ncbi:MAG: hypothetical protein HOK67_05305 [Deltaproteobacteria bacterium]|nr:hypothetical protein [Deltaproteobacteria bacterium]MBT4642798.1 hypothetical protein [Deltaproteobacteria bacterium]MBT6499299.1 hypothetical protein [Deltaproteobacteria bacterium]MBT6614488.1 hypothetical protein [Deltaproteobacteria bacterium]MBT7155596.1 hypothetical protein [Deltaproteobacteria bacterium]